jgi:hypothetical protein
MTVELTEINQLNQQGFFIEQKCTWLEIPLMIASGVADATNQTLQRNILHFLFALASFDFLRLDT